MIGSLSIPTGKLTGHIEHGDVPIDLDCIITQVIVFQEKCHAR